MTNECLNISSYEDPRGSFLLVSRFGGGSKALSKTTQSRARLTLQENMDKSEGVRLTFDIPMNK